MILDFEVYFLYVFFLGEKGEGFLGREMMMMMMMMMMMVCFFVFVFGIK